MRIAIDAHNLLTDRRGIGVYLRALLPRLLARGDVDATLIVRDVVPALVKRRLAAELGTDRFRLARSVPRACDLTWHPWNGTFYSSRAPSVVTIHDCAPFAFPAADERVRVSQQEPFRRSVRTAKRIITVSHFSKLELSKYLGAASDRIDVVYHGADAVFTPGEPEALPDALRGRPYVLFVGADDERKNLRTLVDAWRSRDDDGTVLVCVTKAQVPEALVLSGVSNERLRDLYRGALCLAMPSRYEGFGLPVLEAMQSGCPVVASRATALPEVCGVAAQYVDEPDDVRGWRDALGVVITDAALRAHLRDAGMHQAARFSWDRSARETFAVFEATLRP